MSNNSVPSGTLLFVVLRRLCLWCVEPGFLGCGFCFLLVHLEHPFRHALFAALSQRRRDADDRLVNRKHKYADDSTDDSHHDGVDC